MHHSIAASIAHSEEFLAAKPRSETVARMLRAGIRVFAISCFSLLALAEIIATTPFFRGARRARVRAAWLHRWSRFACRMLGVRLTTIGQAPARGLLVCNHLSYLDIIVLSSIMPCVFVAKRDVAGWPLFGWLARAGGTLFVQRNRRSTAAQEVAQITAAIEAGLLVVLFPEGTSSDGVTVLPFKSSLLEAAVLTNCPIAAAAIDFHLGEGSVANEVCYWRDMTLLPHLLNLFRKREIQSTIAFAPGRDRAGNRKEIARELQREVIALRS